MDQKRRDAAVHVLILVILILLVIVNGAATIVESSDRQARLDALNGRIEETLLWRAKTDERLDRIEETMRAVLDRLPPR